MPALSLRLQSSRLGDENPLEKAASFQTFFVCFRELRVSVFFRNTIETAQPAELQAEVRPHVPALAHPPPKEAENKPCIDLEAAEKPSCSLHARPGNRARGRPL